MRKTLATVALAGALGITGVAGAAFISPALSYAATGDDSALEERVASLREALRSLVQDGTLTQSQADEVATTLAERGPLGGHSHGGPGGPGGPGGLGGPAVLDAAADALGLTVEELRTAAREGTTLAELAEREGVETGAVVDAMVAAAREHLDAEVAEGDLTQAEADARLDELETRITDRVDEPLRLGRDHGGGRRGGHGRHGDGAEGDETAPTPSASAQSGDA